MSKPGPRADSPQATAPQETVSWTDKVWAVVRQIPAGKVSTYGHVAALAGAPRRARQVGQALGKLPDGNDVPWQRVINARGEISLPKHSGGYHMQRAMLEAEGVTFNLDGRIDLKTHLWAG